MSEHQEYIHTPHPTPISCTFTDKGNCTENIHVPYHNISWRVVSDITRSRRRKRPKCIIITVTTAIASRRIVCTVSCRVTRSRQQKPRKLLTSHSFLNSTRHSLRSWHFSHSLVSAVAGAYAEAEERTVPVARCPQRS